MFVIAMVIFIICIDEWTLDEENYKDKINRNEISRR